MRVDGLQRNLGLGDYSEGSLAANHQTDQVETGDSFNCFVPKRHDFAIGHHHGELSNRLARDAVLCAQQTTGISGDVTADGRPESTCWVGREPQPELLRRKIQVLVDDAGLHLRPTVFG